MDISKRLLSISSLILDNSLVYDIGCDHGLLDVYLTMYKNCRCIAYDVNQDIVNRAISNFEKYGLTDKVSAIVRSGFDYLNLNDNGIMVLAGMGTSTILKILSSNRTKTIICQTNTDQYILRKCVCEYGYYIEDEDIVFDNNRYYVTIKFSFGSSNYSYEELLLGPVLIKKKDLIFDDYLDNLYQKNIKAYNKCLEFNLDSDVISVINTLKKYNKR